MNYSNYFKTPLEQWIEDQYRSDGILTPLDLDIDKIAMTIGVDIIYHDNSPFSENEDKVIFLDRRDGYIEQRRIFFHELCHVIRHSGDQRWMPELFREAQEYDANRFALYAAVPFFMVEQLVLPESESEAYIKISETFKIAPAFAKKRLDQIRERISGAKLISSFHAELIASTEHTPNYQQQLRIRAIYGLEDFSRPQALVIEQSQGFDWDKPLHLDVEKNYKLHDSSFYRSRYDATLLPGDLSLPPGQRKYVMIHLSRVAWRHGQNVTRLILPIEAVDDAINF